LPVAELSALITATGTRVDQLTRCKHIYVLVIYDGYLATLQPPYKVLRTLSKRAGAFITLFIFVHLFKVVQDGDTPTRHI
jgi:hypothetical protein